MDEQTKTQIENTKLHLERNIDNLQSAVESNSQTIREHEKELSSLDKQASLNEQNIQRILQTLDKISSNTTWVLRLVVGTLILALMSLVLISNGAEPDTLCAVFFLL